MSNYQSGGGKPAVEENKLFVGGLHWETNEASFKAYFEAFGPVVSAKIKKDNFTEQSRCFGFIEFGNKDSVQKVLQSPSPHMLDGKSIDPKPALPPDANDTDRSTKAFVGGVPTDMHPDVLKEYFSQFGEVKEVSVSKDKNGKRRGFVFVHFVNESTVAKVTEKAFHMVKSMGVEHRVEVKKSFKHPKPQQGGGGRPGGRGRAAAGFDGGFGGYSYGGFAGYPPQYSSGPYTASGGYGNYQAPAPGGFPGGYEGGQGQGFAGQGQPGGFTAPGQMGGFGAQGQVGGYGGQPQAGGYSGGQPPAGGYGGGQPQQAGGYNVPQGQQGGYATGQAQNVGYSAGGQNGGYQMPQQQGAGTTTQGYNAGGAGTNYGGGGGGGGGGQQRNQPGPGGPMRSSYHQGSGNAYHPYQR